MKNILSLLLVFSTSISLFSQNEFSDNFFSNSESPSFKLDYFAVEFRMGLNASTIRGLDKKTIPGINSVSEPYSTKFNYDLDLALTGQAMFQNQLLIQTDLSISSIGTGLRNAKTERYGSIEGMKDVHLQTRFLLGSKKKVWHILVYGVGPYVGFGIGSSGATKGRPLTDDGELDMGKINLKTFDYGISSMIMGYRIWLLLKDIYIPQAFIYA